MLQSIKNVANFIKACFYCNEDYIKTRKHVETFKANKGCKLGIIIFITTSLFSKLKFKVHFSNVIFTKMRRCTFLFFIWKRITLALSFIWLKILALFLVLEVRFFELVFFFLRSRVCVRVRILDDAVFSLKQVKP